MKQKTLFFLLFALAFSACKSSKSSSDSDYTNLQERFLTSKIKKSYIGMTQADFLKSHTRDIDISDVVDFRTQITETFAEGDIKEVTYYFDKDGNKPLYEYIIEFKDGIDVNEIAKSKLGEPNSEDTKWLFDSRKGYKIKAWTFKQKIVLAANLKDTEWETEF